MKGELQPVYPFTKRAADKLAEEAALLVKMGKLDASVKTTALSVEETDCLALSIIKLVREGKLDSRSTAADQLLDYASIRFGDKDPINDLQEYVESQTNKPPQQG